MIHLVIILYFVVRVAYQIKMDIFLQQLVNGLALGSIYALLALGYTMVYGILRLINFAHGDILMLGALSAWSAIAKIQTYFPTMPELLQLLLALGFAIVVCMFSNMVIERIAYRPLRYAPKMAPLITVLSVSLCLQALAMIIWSREPVAFPQYLPNEPLALLGTEATITGREIIIMITSFFVMAGLSILVEKTKLGRAMRAAAENIQMASLMGINPNAIIRIAFLLSAALAALAGVMIASSYGSAHFYMGFLPGLKAFTAAILGGIGNLYGAMLGGILLGIIETMASGYLSDLTNGALGSNYQHIFAFIVLVLVLLFKPTGLIGERHVERV